MNSQAKRDLLAELLRARAGDAAPHLGGAGLHSSARSEAAIKRVSGRGPSPLSFAQHRLWFFDQLNPGTPIYNIHFGLRLTGSLDTPALEQALSEIVRRHDSVRSRFGAIDGIPHQVVVDARPLRLDINDLRHLPAAARALESRRLAALEAARPFDLSTAPLFRASLLRLEDDAHHLLVTMHHIVSDGLSGAIVIRELAASYERLVGGAGAAAPALPIQYADFAGWQREQFATGGAFDGQLAFWKRKLAGDLPVLDLPADFPRGSTQTFRGASHTALLPEQLVGELKGLSRRQGATLFMTLLAAFQLLLSRHSGQDDVIVGSPVAGRTRPECESLIGCFINTVALRNDLSGNPSFIGLLDRVRAGALEAYANQDVPFDKIVEELGAARDRSRPPVFQVLFNMLGAGNAWHTRFHDVLVEPTEPLDEPSKFDLTLYAGETGKTIYLRAIYNADLFSHVRIVELMAQMVRLLEQIALDPSKPIGSFSLLTPGARATLPDPEAAIDSVWEGSFGERVAGHARSTPDRVAIRYAGVDWTYRELDTLSADVAHRLAGAGIGPEDVVCVHATRSPELVAALLGIWKCGAAFLVLDLAYPAARLNGYVRAAKPKARIVIGKQAPAVPVDVAGELELRCSLTVDGKLGEGRLANRTPAPSFEDVSVDRRELDPDGLAYVAFTSGSTGIPKGILGTHRPVSHFLRWHVETFGFDASDRFAMLSGLAHDPLIRDIFTPLWIGASLHIPDERAFDSGDRLAAWLVGERITVAHLTPAMAQLAGQRSDSGAPTASTLRYAFLGGEALTSGDVAALRRVAPSVRCVNFYGATETPQAMAFFDITSAQKAQESEPRRPFPIGRGIEGVQLVLLNGADQLAGIGELAEICVRTPYLARGYLDSSTAASGARFAVNPFTRDAGDRVYRTNDLGRYRPDGTVEWHGRRDGQVKVRGFRVEPGEIENVMLAHAAIAQALVLAVPDENGRTQLRAFCVTRDHAPAPADLREWLRARLPEYMVPSFVVVVEAFPLTLNGKVDRRALLEREIHAVDEDEGEASAYPESPVEEALADIWRELLRVDRPRLTDSFFDLGGHSLLATLLTSRIRHTFDVAVPLRRIFDAPTLGGLALVVSQQMLEASDEMLPPELGLVVSPRPVGSPGNDS